MNKILIGYLIMTFCTASHALYAQQTDIYDISFYASSGVQVDLAEYTGKKLLFITLPETGSEEDSIALVRIAAYSVAYHDRLVIFGIPSYEDGYNETDSLVMRSFFKPLTDAGVIVAQAMYTRKSSAGNQHELFRWLTSKDLNIYFDIDVDGPDDKFFVNENGDLYAVYGSEITLTYPLMQTVLQ